MRDSVTARDRGHEGDFRIFKPKLDKNRLMLILFIKQQHSLLKI